MKRDLYIEKEARFEMNRDLLPDEKGVLRVSISRETYL